LTRNTVDTSTAGEPAGAEVPLKSRNNPRPGLDYVVALDGTMQTGRHVKLRYVPDKLLIESSSFIAYLMTLAPVDTMAPETLALAILDDVNNEIVPRWVQIAVVIAGDGAGMPAQAVVVEDRQPNWDNPGILGNMPSL
jgi:hypothetical protein